MAKAVIGGQSIDAQPRSLVDTRSIGRSHLMGFETNNFFSQLIDKLFQRFSG